MVLVTLRMLVRPEMRSVLLKTMVGMLEPSRVEKGCLGFRLYEDVENKNALFLVEEWETQKYLEDHIRTDNQRRLLVLMDFLSEKPNLRFNTVQKTAGMELIEDVLKKEKTT